jgi:anaerobic nitric oxide reductase flavorubredoxin
MVTELKKGLYWVGVVDWDIRHFHGFELSTHRGTTYNAYLIVDEKVALVDTVWDPFRTKLMENIRRVIDPSKIDVVVANHAEPDHSGSLTEVLRHCPDAELVVSKRGASSIPGHHHADWKFTPVKTGDRISLGSRELVFVEAAMLHWPDSMFTYVTGDNVLISNDAFGEHYATPGRFNDEVDQEALYQEAVKYYANILAPFSPMVTRKIDELVGMGLPLDMIAPSHGVIWRKDPMQIVEKYKAWAAQEGEASAVIIYETMWHATSRMAEAVGEGLNAEGIPYRMYHMSVSDRNDVLTEIFKSKGVVVGSPTLNQGILPTMWPALSEMKGLKFKNKIGGAFGSYGWSGESVGVIESFLQECGIPLAGESVKVNWQPTGEDLEACRKLGAEVARAIKG